MSISYNENALTIGKVRLSAVLLTFLLTSPHFWFAPFVLTAIGYMGVLRKMGQPWWPALIPAGAEYVLTSQLYPKMRTFWRPFSLCCVRWQALQTRL